MIETVLLAFIVAKIKGYKLPPIFKDWAIYPVLICAVAYIYLESTIWRGDYSLVQYSAYFKTIYLSSVIVLAFRYRQFKALLCGLPLIWLGTILNTIAIKANFGKMPVFPSLAYFTGYAKPEMFIDSARYGDFHVLGNAYTHAIPLTDVFDVFGYSVMSIGDILIRSFVFIVLYYCIKESNKETKQIKNILTSYIQRCNIILERK